MVHENLGINGYSKWTMIPNKAKLLNHHHEASTYITGEKLVENFTKTGNKLNNWPFQLTWIIYWIHVFKLYMWTQLILLTAHIPPERSFMVQTKWQTSRDFSCSRFVSRRGTCFQPQWHKYACSDKGKVQFGQDLNVLAWSWGEESFQANAQPQSLLCTHKEVQNKSTCVEIMKQQLVFLQHWKGIILNTPAY